MLIRNTMNILTVYLTRYIIKVRWMLILLVVTIVSSCQPAWICGTIEKISVSNSTDAFVILQLRPYSGPEYEIYDSVHCSTYIEVIPRNGYTNRFRVFNCYIDSTLNDDVLCSLIFPKIDHGARCENVSDVFRYNTLYNITDTMCLRLGGTAVKWNETILKDYSVTDTSYNEEKQRYEYHRHVHITDELLSKMQKDYSMLEKFPEFYSKEQ